MVARCERLEPIQVCDAPRLGATALGLPGADAEATIQVCDAPRLGATLKRSRFREHVVGEERVATPQGADQRRAGSKSAPWKSRSALPTQDTKLQLATRRVLVELAWIAFSDIGDVFDEHGAVIPFADLAPGVRSAIAEYCVRRHRDGNCSVRVKLHSKLPALVALGRYHGVFAGHTVDLLSQLSRIARSAAPRPTQPGLGMGL